MKRLFYAILLLMMVMLPFSACARSETKPNETTTRSSTFSTVKEAGAYLRQQMKQHVTTITFNYNGALSDTLYSELYQEALAHTGVPTEGDYLRRLCNYYNYNQSTNGNVRTYTYTIDYATTLAQEAEVDAKLAEIFAALKLDGKSDYERARLIYDYICDHVVYDSANLYTSGYYLKYTAYSALILGKATCGGFSTTLYRMLLETGIDCRVISGYGGGGDHGWNIVRMGDLYYDTDVTWEHVSGRYKYFLRSEFYEHRRNAEFRTPEFYAAYPMATSDYNPTEHDPTDHTCGRNAIWTLKDGVLTISGSGDMTNYFDQDAMPWRDSSASITRVVIKAGITSIGDYAFANCDHLTSIEIPSSVTSIGIFAFYNCKSLTRFPAMDGVTSIGNRAFYNCESLETIAIPDGVKTLDKELFYNCKKLSRVVLPARCEGFTVNGIAFGGCDSLETVTLPEGTKKLNAYAFYQWNGLKSIALPDSVTTLGIRVFLECKNLTHVTIGNGVTAISDSAFRYCNNLQSIVFSAGLKRIGTSAFDGCGKLSEIGDLSGVTHIGAGAFYECASIESLSFGTVDGIGNNTFYGCKALNSVAFLCCNGDIGNNAFRGCDSLTRVTGLGSSSLLDDNSYVTSIGKSAFRGCGNLKSLDLGWDLTSIGAYAFCQCGQLRQIGENLSGVTHIGEYAFYECGVFDVNLYGFGAVDGIGKYAFYGCNSLFYVSFEGCNGVIEDGAFYRCGNLTEVSGLRGVTRIGNNAFRDCTWLEGLDIGTNLTTLGSGAFYNCEMLLFSADFLKNVQTIDQYAFYNCSSLKHVDFSEHLTAIGGYAFGKCGALTDIRFTGSAPTIGASAFNQVTATAWYPQNDASWTEAVRANYGGKLTWLIDAPAVWGEPVYQWSEDHTSVTATRTDTVYASRVETETVGATLSLALAPTESRKGRTLYASEPFANEAFIQQTLIVEDIPALRDMRVLRLPAMLTTIEAEAFVGADCEAIIIPDGVTAIGARAFADCAHLVYIRIPASAVTLAEDALAGCASVRIENAK